MTCRASSTCPSTHRRVSHSRRLCHVPTSSVPTVRPALSPWLAFSASWQPPHHRYSKREKHLKQTVSLQSMESRIEARYPGRIICSLPKTATAQVRIEEFLSAVGFAQDRLPPNLPSNRTRAGLPPFDLRRQSDFWENCSSGAVDVLLVYGAHRVFLIADGGSTYLDQLEQHVRQLIRVCSPSQTLRTSRRQGRR